MQTFVLRLKVILYSIILFSVGIRYPVNEALTKTVKFKMQTGKRHSVFPKSTFWFCKQKHTKKQINKKKKVTMLFQSTQQYRVQKTNLKHGKSLTPHN